MPVQNGPMATNTSPNPSHSRNKTGLVGKDRAWSRDPAINHKWESLTAAVQSQDTVDQVQSAFVRHATTTLARTHFNLDNQAAYQAAAHALRDHLIARWNTTQQHHTSEDVKRVYYLSMEFLLGRSLQNSILNLNLPGLYSQALSELGINLERVYEEEVDAALGNGGLGRLAACFMDSLATLDLPAWGYGLRYQYGIFQQQIINGQQVEFPDYWLNFGNAWEVPRMDVCYDVSFYGKSVKDPVSMRAEWHGEETVEAVAYDVPIPGFGTSTTINIRLWGSTPRKRFDLQQFNEGNYTKSVEEQQRAEHITSVLYPNDNTMAGKELRLKQQYFFVAATIQDILRRFKKVPRSWSALPDFAAIQLNDTHPSLGIAELMRLLVDVEGVPWDEAWEISRRVFSFTNHTVLPEAMEKWPVDMMTVLLPRHMQIIYDINLFYLQAVERKFPGDRARLARMSIIEEAPFQQVRMAFLAVVGSYCVNGVAKIHSDLIKQTIFKDFVDFYGSEKFQNKTNGITPRRYITFLSPL
jgi:starch phosphorylase